MKTINLQDIPLYWTTCQKSKARHEPMNKMLESLGIKGTMIDGPITSPYTIGVAKGYIQALTQSEAPFTVLEDDATIVEERPNPSLIFPIDDSIDAIYIGTSVFGRINNNTIVNSTLAANYNEHYNRVFNMLTFHGILYLSQKYVNHVVNTIEKFLLNPVGGVDDPVADSMWKYNVLAVKKPIVYQKDGHSEPATKAILNTIL